ncbi:MAG: hypothetical protein P4L84_21035 [Isosphaeraceae bacterium]|nr:hypothetical protein [Isosphaeraceae bacterium]
MHSPSRRRVLRALAVPLAFAIEGTRLAARQEHAAAPADDPGTALFRAMRAHAASLKVTAIAPGRPALAVALRDEPLERYSDPPRNIQDATLWAWGDSGRPGAILKVEHMPKRPEATRWLYGLVSLAAGRIEVEFRDDQRWTSTMPGVEMRPIAEAPAPAASESVRLSQMKALARRFSASEGAGGTQGRLQLRLMPRPLIRYSDGTLGIRDGALFAFAYGTNPDILLVIESQGPTDTTATWQFGLARLGGGEPIVALDGKEVWSQSGANPPARLATYMNRWVPESGEFK